MTFKLIERYEDHLWYPIIVKIGGERRIVEMQGIEVNRWNDMVRQQWYEDVKNHPRGWCII